jgi:hypothetical protein
MFLYFLDSLVYYLLDNRQTRQRTAAGRQLETVSTCPCLFSCAASPLTLERGQRRYATLSGLSGQSLSPSILSTRRGIVASAHHAQSDSDCATAGERTAVVLTRRKSPFGESPCAVACVAMSFYARIFFNLALNYEQMET